MPSVATVAAVIAGTAVCAGAALLTIGNADRSDPFPEPPPPPALEAGLTPAQWDEVYATAANYDLSGDDIQRVVVGNYDRWMENPREAGSHCGYSYYWGDGTFEALKRKSTRMDGLPGEQALWAVTINSLIINNC